MFYFCLVIMNFTTKSDMYCCGVRSSTEVAAVVARRYRSSDQIEAAREPDINRSTRDCTWETLVGDIVCGGRRDRLNKKTFPHTRYSRADCSPNSGSVCPRVRGMCCGREEQDISTRVWTVLNTSFAPH